MKKVYTIFLTFILAFNLFALDVPKLKGTINDYANLLSKEESENLQSFLNDVDNTSKVQIALLTLPSLEGESIEEYSMKVVEKWKLGDKEKDSGVLLLISLNDKKIRIEVGYGLEKDLTDAISARIIKNIIAPSFKNGNYYKGINEALVAIKAYALKDESLIKEIKNKIKPKKSNKIQINLLFFISFLFFMFSKRGRGWDFFWPFITFTQLFGYKNRYGKKRKSDITSFFYNDDHHSSGSSFSGGGGSFGGGGASGGW